MNDLTKPNRTRTLIPAGTVVEDTDRVVVRLEMPGVQKSDLDIAIEGQSLTVRGRRQEPAIEGTWWVRERRRGDFERTYSVDPSIDLDKATAELADGVLTLTLPVKEAAKPRKIEIRSA